MTKQAKLQVEQVELVALARLPGINPNVMSDHDYQALKTSIANNEVGYLQPIVVAEQEDGTRLLVDGEHRVRALLELGYTHADAAVGSLDQARLLRLSLHLRGQHDDALVAAELRALVDAGYDHSFLVDSTPFEQDELSKLLNFENDPGLLDLSLNTQREPGVAEEVSGNTDSPEEDTRSLPDESTFNLTLRFSSKTDRDRVSQTFRQHGVTPEDGALNVLGLK